MAVATLEREPHAAPPEQHPPEGALSRGMMGMYIFLASEVMFFGSLFAVYFYMIGSHAVWPPEGTQAVPWWPLPTINTFVLVCSGVTAHFGLEALRENGPLGRQKYVGAAFLAGFLICSVGAATLALIYDEAYFDAGLGYGAGLVMVVAMLAMLGWGPFARGRATFYGLWIATILLGAGFESGQAYEFLTAHINLTTNEFASAFFTMTGFHGAHVAGGLVLLLLILFRAMRGQFSPQHHVGPAAVTLYWHFVDLVWLFLLTVLYIAVTAGSP
jgi:heme/copper-type cytochrome/quinol oxidase subunit 3